MARIELLTCGTTFDLLRGAFGRYIYIHLLSYNCKKPSLVTGLARDGGALVLVAAVICFMILR